MSDTETETTARPLSGQGVRAAIATGQLHLGDVVASEEGLVQLYDRALAKLDPDASNRTDDAGSAKS